MTTATIQFRREDKKKFEAIFNDLQKSLMRDPNQPEVKLSNYIEEKRESSPDEIEPYSDFSPLRWKGLDVRFIEHLQHFSGLWFRRVTI